MLDEELTKEINQALRESIKSSQKLVNRMQSQEEIDSIKEGLSAAIKNINGLKKNNATIDADVLEAFGTLAKSIKKFNEFNGAELIPISKEVDNILFNGTNISTSSTNDKIKSKVAALRKLKEKIARAPNAAAAAELLAEFKQQIGGIPSDQLEGLDISQAEEAYDKAIATINSQSTAQHSQTEAERVKKEAEEIDIKMLYSMKQVRNYLDRDDIKASTKLHEEMLASVNTGQEISQAQAKTFADFHNRQKDDDKKAVLDLTGHPNEEELIKIEAERKRLISMHGSKEHPEIKKYDTALKTRFAEHSGLIEEMDSRLGNKEKLIPNAALTAHIPNQQEELERIKELRLLLSTTKKTAQLFMKNIETIDISPQRSTNESKHRTSDLDKGSKVDIKSLDETFFSTQHPEGSEPKKPLPTPVFKNPKLASKPDITR
jgi:hypothetical protein